MAWPVVALVAGLAALAFGALGLWWGERGRRRTVESLLSFGHPAGPRPGRVSAPKPDAETIAAGLGREISEETLETGAKEIFDQAQALGRPISMRDARVMAERMLHPDAGTDPEFL